MFAYTERTDARNEQEFPLRSGVTANSHPIKKQEELAIVLLVSYGDLTRN